MKIRWKRDGVRVLRFDHESGLIAFIFGAHGSRHLWGWAVWGSNNRSRAADVEISLSRARQKANEAIADFLEAQA